MYFWFLRFGFRSFGHISHRKVLIFIIFIRFFIFILQMVQVNALGQILINSLFLLLRVFFSFWYLMLMFNGNIILQFRWIYYLLYLFNFLRIILYLLWLVLPFISFESFTIINHLCFLLLLISSMSSCPMIFNNF